MTYAIACKSCGHVLQYAYEQKERGPDGPAGPWTVSSVPLTPTSRVPVICPKCGATRQWRSPATAEDVTKFETKKAREARATELCQSLNVDGMFKIPDDVRGPPEVKNAISNLLAPLEGEALKFAQSLVLKVAKSGVVVTSDVWIEMYDRAVTKAISDAKAMAKETKGAKATA